MSDIKKNVKSDDDLVRNTEGGEMPDPNRKLQEKASEAADIFEEQNQEESAKVMEFKRDPNKKAS